MDVTLLYFDDCPNWKVADERLAVVTARRPDITVNHQRVSTLDEAERVGFLGSPSIHVDGVDAFAQPGAQVSLSCRRFATPEGYAGAPTLEQLQVALGVRGEPSADDAPEGL